jgi:hypothetical protein
MLTAITRYLMSSEYGPFDRLVELGVFLFVGYEVVIETLHRRKARIRGNLIAQRVSAMRTAMAAGQELMLSTPGSGDARVTEWANAVQNWDAQTRVLLKSFSAQAEAAFLLHVPISPYVTGSVGAPFDYLRLTTGLLNLRGIIENPDVYF